MKCELTPRCRLDAPCAHHLPDCEHLEHWTKDSEVWAGVMGELNRDMDLAKDVIALLRRVSLTNRRMVMETLWMRFHEKPRCGDDPPK